MKEEIDKTETKKIDEIEEINEFEQFENYTEDVEEEVEDLSDWEKEETEGGVVIAPKLLQNIPTNSNTLNIGTLKSYAKHCGGIEIKTKNPTVNIAGVGARVGIIDKIYIAKSSTLARAKGIGTSNLVVTRRTSNLGMVTLEIHGHQKGEPKNWRFVVVRVIFM